jgi:signal transduction histidine kinase
MTTFDDDGLVADDPRVERLILALERLVAGDLEERVPLSPGHDRIDAVSHGLNALAGELQYASRNLRRRVNDAEAVSRAKSAVFRKVGHEIRLQLQRFADRSEGDAGDGAPLRALLELADGLLDIARLESSEFELVLEPVPLRETVAAIVQGLEPAALAKGLELQLDVVPPVPQTIMADGKRLRGILAHIAGNAVKYTTRGHVVVRLQAAGPEAIAVDVIDTGTGISASQAETIFEPFRAEPSDAPGLKGSGLGLAFARRLARAMGGDVQLVESRPQAGSTFSVLLPVRSA